MPNDSQFPSFGEQGQQAPVAGSATSSSRLRPYQGGAAASATEPAYNGWQAISPAVPFRPAQRDPALASNGHTSPSGSERIAAEPPVDPFAAASAPSAPASLSSADSAIAAGLYKAINAVRGALPLVQRLLPLFEGNIATAATAITALVAPTQPSNQQLHHPPAAPPPPAPVSVQVDLEPIERSLGEVEHGLVEVRTSHWELRTQVADQTTAIKRFEGQLDHVREATDRNTLEQQELVEDIRAVGSRVSTFAIIGLVLLAVSLLVNLFLVVQMQHILR